MKQSSRQIHWNCPSHGGSLLAALFAMGVFAPTGATPDFRGLDSRPDS